MNFARPDAAPEALLNRILWHAAHGWNVPYPVLQHGTASQDDDDDH